MSELLRRVTPSPLYDTILSEVHHHAILAALIITALLLAGFGVWSLINQRRADERYQYALNIGTAVLFVAALSYGALIVKFVLGYARQVSMSAAGEIISYVSTHDPILNLPVRYIDWAITVPMLVIEVLAISALTGKNAYRLRTAGIFAAFLMIFCGYVGGAAISSGHDMAARYLWGGISTAFFFIVYAILIYALRRSMLAFSHHTGRAYRLALIGLMTTWFLYPIGYVLAPLLHTSGSTLALQVFFCTADILSKVGFGLLIQRVVRLRMRDEARVLALSKPVKTTSE